MVSRKPHSVGAKNDNPCAHSQIAQWPGLGADAAKAAAASAALSAERAAAFCVSGSGGPAFCAAGFGCGDAPRAPAPSV
jgi:hypothetical protein